MAESSMIALMLMLFLCFIGMLVMFLFVIRSNTALSESIRDASKQQRQLFNDIERHLMELSFTVNKMEVKDVCDQFAEFSKGDTVVVASETQLKTVKNTVEGEGSDSSLPKLSL